MTSVFYSQYIPDRTLAGVEGRSVVDLTSTSFADLMANAADYSSATQYQKGAIVYNQNSTWVYVNNTAGSNNAPPTLPTISNAYWELLGTNGTFTWIAYANSTNGTTFTDFTTGAYDTSGIIRKWIGIAPNKTSAVESTSSADYSWTKIVGEDGAPGSTTATVNIFQRGSSAPTLPSAATTYTFGNPPTLTGLNNGWVTSIALTTGTSPLYVASATASSNTGSDTIAANEWSSPVVLASNGTNGLSVATVFLYRRTTTATAPAVVTTGTATFTFSDGTITGQPADWQRTVPSSTGGSFLWVIQATASNTTATDSIVNTEWSAPSLISQDGPSGLNSATIFLYQRATTPPTAPTGPFTYTFSTGTLSGGTIGSWTQTIPAGTDPLYVITATAASNTATDTIETAEFSAVRLLAQNGTPGSAGSNTAIIYLYQRGTSAPALPTGTFTYTFSTGALTTTGSLNNWSRTIPSGTDPIYVIAVTATSNTATDTFEPAEFSSAVVLAQNGLDGSNNATITLYQRSPTAPSAPTGSFTYTFSSRAITPTIGTSWTLAVPSGTDPLYVTTANASSNTATASITFSTPVLFVQNGAPGTSPLVYEIVTSTPVIVKDAADAATAGAHTSVTIQGRRYNGNVTTNFGWVTVTANGDTEATTATDTASAAFSLSPTTTAGKSSYTVRLYNQATVAGATLLDTQTIAVVFKGAAGAPGANAITAILSNESHVFPANNDGSVSSYTGSGTVIRVYEGATELSYDGAGTTNGTWTVSSAVTNITRGTLTDSGAFLTVGDHSGVANGTDTSSITYTITGRTLTGQTINLTRTQTFSKSRTGAPGSNATRTAVLDMYQWAASAPSTHPSGNSTYTWSTGTFTAPGVANNWTLVPGTPSPGQTLYVVRQIYTDTATSANSTVTWTATSSFPSSVAGNNGQRVGLLELYRWSAASPGTYPSGTSTYTWSDGTFTLPGTTNGWSLTPPAAVLEQTLWAVSVRVSNNLTTATTDVTWPANPTPYAIGYAGRNGVNGAPGVRGSKEFFATGSSWSDTTADTAITSLGLEKVLLDQVTISNGTSFAQTRFWNGSSWATISQVINGNLLVNGTVGASALAADTVLANTFNVGSTNFQLNGAFGGAGKGALVVSNGQQNMLTAGYINATDIGLSIKDAAGNVLMQSSAAAGSSTASNSFAPAISNSNITISAANGQISGIGATGNNTVVANNQITISGTGQISGISTTGNNTVVANSQITVNTSGQLTGIGTANVTVDNTKVTINTDGTLGGAGSGQVTLPGLGNNYFRVSSTGGSATSNGGLASGFYVANSTTAFASGARSYTVVRIPRNTGAPVLVGTYDVYGNAANATTMATALNAINSDNIVVVFTADEPQLNRLSNNLNTAMYRHGASPAIFGSSNFKFRGAYILIGIGGCGQGNGTELYQGAVDGDTNAWVDAGFSLINGVLSGVSASGTPNSITDYGYTGELNATRGAIAGTNLRDSLGNSLTDAAIITSAGTAAAVANQTGWATYATHAPADVAPKAVDWLGPRTYLDANVPVNAAPRWLRIARVDASGGRGTAAVTLASGGGGLTPGELSLEVSVDWSGLATLTVLSASRYHPVDTIRLSRTGTQTYLDVLIHAVSAASSFRIEVIPNVGSGGTWTAHYVDNPTVGTTQLGSIYIVGTNGSRLIGTVIMDGSLVNPVTSTLFDPTGGVKTNGIQAIDKDGVSFDVLAGSTKAVAERGADITANRTSAGFAGQKALATKDTASWSADVSNRPVELTDGRIDTGLDTAGRNKVGIVAGTTNSHPNIDILGTINGANIATNPEFIDGTTTGWQVYNNQGGPLVTIEVQDDLNAPNSSGKRLAVNYVGGGTPGVNPTPGFGGALQTLTDSVVGGFAGRAAPGHYARNSTYLFSIIANIPVGRNLEYAANSIGVGSSFEWLTTTDGTGNWRRYVLRVKTGTSGSFSTMGHLYIYNGSNNAFTWYIAKYDQIDITGSPKTLLGRGGLTRETGVAVLDNDAITSLGTSQAVLNQGTLATKSSVNLNSTEVTNKSLANLDSTASTKLGGIEESATNDRFQDRRNTNELPSWYFSNLGGRTVNEFKHSVPLGVPGNSSNVFGALVTTVDWGDISGGEIKQKFTYGTGSLAGTSYVRTSNGTAAWGAWTKDFNGYLRPTFDANDLLETGSTVATVGNFKTSAGTAAGFSGQKALATRDDVLAGTHIRNSANTYTFRERDLITGSITPTSVSILPNWNLDIADSSGNPAFILQTEGSGWTGQFQDTNKNTLRVNAGGNYGISFPAVAVNDKMVYIVRVRHRSSATSLTGLYLRLQELNAALPAGATHVGANGAAGVAGRTSLIDLVGNGPMPGTTWTEVQFSYTPTVGTRFASMSMYNWGSGVDYEVDWVQMIPGISEARIDALNLANAPAEAAATKGAVIGTNLNGSFTNTNISNFFADAAIGNAQIGSVSAGKITTGTLAAGNTITVGNSGGNAAITLSGQNRQILVRDANNAIRVKIGDLSV